MDRKKGVWLIIWVVLVVVIGVLTVGMFSKRNGYGPWQGGPGTGWMANAPYGFGMQPPGYGTGPGAIGGYGGGYGMGPGMMGGYGSAYGVGPGMMGGYGGGMMGSAIGSAWPDMPGSGYGAGRPGTGYGMDPALGALDLTQDQIKQITDMRHALADRERELVAQALDERAKLNELYLAEPQDWGAISKSWQKILDLQRQQVEARVGAEQNAQSLLTDKQRHEWRHAQRAYGWMGAQ